MKKSVFKIKLLHINNASERRWSNKKSLSALGGKNFLIKQYKRGAINKNQAQYGKRLLTFPKRSHQSLGCSRACLLALLYNFASCCRRGRWREFSMILFTALLPARPVSFSSFGGGEFSETSKLLSVRERARVYVHAFFTRSRCVPVPTYLHNKTIDELFKFQIPGCISFFLLSLSESFFFQLLSRTTARCCATVSYVAASWLPFWKSARKFKFKKSCGNKLSLHKRKRDRMRGGVWKEKIAKRFWSGPRMHNDNTPLHTCALYVGIELISPAAASGGAYESKTYRSKSIPERFSGNWNRPRS